MDAATKSSEEFDGSVKRQVYVAILKVSKNPLPKIRLIAEIGDVHRFHSGNALGLGTEKGKMIVYKLEYLPLVFSV